MRLLRLPPSALDIVHKSVQSSESLSRNASYCEMLHQMKALTSCTHRSIRSALCVEIVHVPVFGQINPLWPSSTGGLVSRRGALYSSQQPVRLAVWILFSPLSHCRWLRTAGRCPRSGSGREKRAEIQRQGVSKV